MSPKRWKPVKVRAALARQSFQATAADGGEQQRIWLRRDDALKGWTDCHLSKVYSSVAASAFRVPFLGKTLGIFPV
jgi:hypothetical protein